MRGIIRTEGKRGNEMVEEGGGRAGEREGQGSKVMVEE